MKTEEGIMVVKDDKAWGEWRDGGHGGGSGGCWMDIDNARIYDPRFVLKPTDVTYEGGPDVPDLRTAKLVKVRRTVTVEILGEYL